MVRLLAVCILFFAATCLAQADSVDRIQVIREFLEKDSIISIKQALELRDYLRRCDSLHVADSLKVVSTVNAAGGGAEYTGGTPEGSSALSEEEISKSSVFAPIIAAEVLGQNVFVWGWDYYVLQKNYAKTGPSYWKRNIKEGWEWDHNHWAINFFGHPYQGSMYYATARAGGYGFYRSLLWAGLGSFTWEMFAETEYPAPNDLVATTIGGSMYGEVLYRLSRLAYNRAEVPWYRQLAAFVLEPAGFLQRKAFGNRDFYTGWVPVELFIAVGGGSRFGSDYRFGNQSADELDDEWNDHFGFLAAHLEYGKPYTITRQPFDYFTVDVLSEAGFEGAVLQMDVMGKLKNVGVHGRGHWLDFAINLDYDTFYGDLATVSTISLGGALDLALWVTPSLRFRVMNQAYWIILGTADMGYDDLIKEVHPEYESDMDNYQYNTGVKYSLLVEFLYRERLRLYNKVVVDAMRTIPNSLPHYGAEGWDFLLLNNTSLEYKICDWLQVGSRLDTYVKMAAYSTEIFEPMSRRIFNYGLYFNFKLM